jgi:hypothetical protein
MTKSRIGKRKNISRRKQMKTSELIGAALDWAVAKAWQPVYKDASLVDAVRRGYNPSTNWEYGGPIIERKRLCVTPGNGYWGSVVHDRLFEDDGSDHHALGPTPLIAAMRCYVASELGDTVDVPEELTK